jgi:hypothetical protein
MGAPPRLGVLFFLRAPNFDRVFECFLREMLLRGHKVDVVFDGVKRGLGADPTRAFEALRREFPGLSYRDLPPRRDWWLRGATALRYVIDYVRYLEPEFAGADALRERAQSRVPAPLRLLLRPFFRSGRRNRSRFARMLRGLEAALPVSQDLRSLIRETRPNVVLVSPLVGLGSRQGDALRAAAVEGVPTVLPVASWDNLTNKGVIREQPTRMIVWNARQIAEAVDLHGLAPSRVTAVGAHTWDHWFDWRPTATPGEFARKVGLEEDRAFVLYVCSSGFIAGTEAEFIDEWLTRLRSSGRRELRELGVVIRPHPQNVEYWRDFDLTEPGLTVVFPRGGAAPTDDERKADYYDSIFYSHGVVGINTSALAETAIVRRPAFTLLNDRFRATQEGTLHFSQIADPDGVLVVARTWEEHHAHLVEVLENPAVHAARIERFLNSFVRPRGLATSAASLAIDEVETAARERPERVEYPLGARIAASIVVALLQVAGPRWLWPRGRLRRPGLRSRLARLA